MEYPICPVAKPRMTRADKWRKRPATAKYWSFVDLCRLNRCRASLFRRSCDVYPAYAKVWSKKKKAVQNDKPHMSRPDLSNLLKALEDAIYSEDSVIYDIHIEKRWGYEGQIIIKEGLK